MGGDSGQKTVSGSSTKSCVHNARGLVRPQGAMPDIILRTSADDVSHLVNALAIKPASTPALDRGSLQGPARHSFAPDIGTSFNPPGASRALPSGINARVVVHHAAARSFSRSSAGLPWSSSRDQLLNDPRPITPIAPTFRSLTYKSSYNSHYRPPMSAAVLPTVYNHHRVPYTGGAPGLGSHKLMQLPDRRSPFSASPRSHPLDFGNTYFDNVTLSSYGAGYGHQN